MILSIGMGPTYEALAHYLHGAATIFFLTWSFRVFPVRKKSMMMRMMFYNLAFLTFCNIRDTVFLVDGLWEDRYLTCLSVLMDLIFVPLFSSFFFEVLSPGWVKARRVVSCMTPQILFLSAYAIYPSEHIYNVALVFTFVFAIISVCIIFRLSYKYWKYIESNYSYTEKIGTGWVLVGALVMMLCTTVYLTVFYDETWLGNAVYYGISVLSWVLLYSLAIRHTVLPSPSFIVFHSPWDKPETDQVPVPDELDIPLVLQQIRDGLEHVMKVQKMYLNPKLTLVDLASAIGTNRTYLSDYLNKVLHTTFYEYVNTLRVKEACTILDERNQNRSMQEVSEMSGFNSTSTFNRSFFKVMGMTPSQYASKS